ncbi:carbon-monoxide dehydrogenase large subunit [Alteromonas sp. 5E99-2]|uniref:aerobic carbon-monoxide dehydrogenase large subunit n=1 Tax=Alteromonas sp. 5E99-2 TaxID=2817683 RepID=UPI001A9911EE|nr:aerobic carbon-monoxide dehydrogenase large subunit [Alteromonas sp. 5E99-2]MBO1256151.1 carbon-monoxide dehydrogenase large subunit [Alteromonas sp. 5E99-2]
MNTSTDSTAVVTENPESTAEPEAKSATQNVQGIGCSRKRKEDPKFVRGQGQYVDDVKLPGMLFIDMVRSPYAHANIVSINKEKALALPGVQAVLTADDLKPLNLHWMPTLAGDMQAVLADKKVHFQYQEVAAVIADDRYIAADALELVEVEYEILSPMVDPYDCLNDDAPIVRDDLVDASNDNHPNKIFEWEVGDKDDTDDIFSRAPVVVKEDMYYPRVHPSPLETCGSVASFDPVKETLTLYVTSQAPHVVRTIVSSLSGIPESKVRVISPDIGGGFGNKVGIYPGYVLSVVASIVLGVPVKFVENRTDHLSTTAWARDYFMTGELAADENGIIKALRVNVLGDHGAFNSQAQPTKWPAGFMSICTGSYDIPQAYLNVVGVYTNKSPGGVAYRCSFRVTEAVYVIERTIDLLARKIGVSLAEIRMRNFVKPEQFPYDTPLGWQLDSGDYHTALRKVMDAVDYPALLLEQKEKREKGELMGIGLCTFTEVVGAGPTRNCDILGVGMFDSAEIRVHPDGSIIARMGTITQGQGHTTTYAQIIASELGIHSDLITIEEGDTDTAPYGLGTYGSRSTPVAGAAVAKASRLIRDKAKKIAAHLLEVAEDDLEWNDNKFSVKGAPGLEKTMAEIASASYNSLPDDMEPGLEAVYYYDPPNFTYPFGAYLCVVDIDKGTGETKVRRFYALDDCGTRINPMIIDGQIHGGLTEGFAVAFGQELPFDKEGNILGNTFMDYFIPTAVETPKWETDYTVTPSPHHPLGAKGVAESPHVGSIPCFTSAVADAFAHLGVTHLDMPHTAYRVWQQINELNIPESGISDSVQEMIQKAKDGFVPEVSNDSSVNASKRVKKASDSIVETDDGMAVHKEFTIKASADDGWTILQDISLLAGCFPGGRVTEKVDDSNFIAVVEISIGPITMKFDGKITVLKMDDNTRSMQISGSGQDSKGTSSAEMNLTAEIVETSDGFDLVGDATFKVRGKLAAFGGRMIGQVADQMLNQFGVRYQDHVLAIGSNSDAEAARARLEQQPKSVNALSFGFSVFVNMVKGLFRRKK